MGFNIAFDCYWHRVLSQAQQNQYVVLAYENSSYRNDRPMPTIVADLSESRALFGGFGGSSDGSDPFAIYGSIFKKYLIEVLDGERIVSRKRGFTVVTCTSAISSQEEASLGPDFQFIPTGEKVSY